MAPDKKPVGRTPICEPSYLRRIDPIWVHGPVPNRFWHDKSHRRDYLLWLGHKLRFKWMPDWYKLTYEDARRNCGSGVISQYWDYSEVEAVKQCFPEYDWQEWLFAKVPVGFWSLKENRRRYMQWLGQQLGFRRPQDWYAVTVRDFQQHKGGTLLVAYDCCPSAAVMDYFPRHDWKEWLFQTAPNGFWHDQMNRHRYLRWLGKRLGYRRPEDWYAIRFQDFVDHGGRECLKSYHLSPALAVKDLFPGHYWEEWRFPRVSRGFWNRLENRQQYLRWLGKQLGIRRLEDWLHVQGADFVRHCGGGLLHMMGSPYEVLRTSLPPLRETAKGGGRSKAACRFVGRLLSLQRPKRRDQRGVVVLVGTKKALGMAVRRQDTARRYTALRGRLERA
jgi:hypothetical protein